MQYTARINWKYGVNLKTINRGMTSEEIKETLVRDVANRKYSARIQSLDPKYIRKAVGMVLRWHRGTRVRQRVVPTTNVTNRDEQVRFGKVTFNIGGCKITVPRGVNVEVEF